MLPIVYSLEVTRKWFLMLNDAALYVPFTLRIDKILTVPV